MRAVVVMIALSLAQNIWAAAKPSFSGMPDDLTKQIFQYADGNALASLLLTDKHSKAVVIDCLPTHNDGVLMQDGQHRPWQQAYLLGLSSQIASFNHLDSVLKHLQADSSLWRKETGSAVDEDREPEYLTLINIMLAMNLRQSILIQPSPILRQALTLLMLEYYNQAMLISIFCREVINSIEDCVSKRCKLLQQIDAASIAASLNNAIEVCCKMIPGMPDLTWPSQDKTLLDNAVLPKIKTTLIAQHDALIAKRAPLTSANTIRFGKFAYREAEKHVLFELLGRSSKFVEMMLPLFIEKLTGNREIPPPMFTSENDEDWKEFCQVMLLRASKAELFVQPWLDRGSS